MSDKFGVRVYKMPDSDVLVIKQTVKKSGRYVIDLLKDGAHREVHVSLDDTVGIADGIRKALRGKLTRA